MNSRDIPETLKTLGVEFRSAALKAFATALVVAISGFALSRVKPINDLLSASPKISYLGIILWCAITSLVAVVLTYSLLSRRIVRLRAELVDVRDIATRDSLTSLYNASQIKPLLGRRIEQAKADGLMFSLIMVDIDHFKRINDSYTHSVGNFILRQVADQLPGRSGGDTTFRFGGDEFLIASKASNRENEGYGFAERVRREVANSQYLVEENSHRRESLTVSCGVTDYASEDTPEDMVTRVTMALHLAKQPRKDTDGVERSKNFVYVSNRPRSA